MRSSTPPPALSSASERVAQGDVPEGKGRAEEAADFCLRALRADQVAPLLDDTAATGARVLGCELVRVMELRDDGEEVVVAVSGVGERAQVFGEGAGSGVEVPIPGRGRAFGVLGAYSKTARGFPPADVSFLQVLAITAGHAVERLRAERSSTADVPADPALESAVHELGNVLTVIAGNAELLLDRYDAGSPRPAELEAIEGAARRAEAILQRLRASAPPAGTAKQGPPTRMHQAVDP